MKKSFFKEVRKTSEKFMGNYAEFIAGKIDENIEKLFFENKKKFVREILKFQNEFFYNKYSN